MTQAFIAKLSFIIWKTRVGAQKIDGSLLQTHDMAAARFSLQNSLGKIWFFEDTFLLINTSIDVVLAMLILYFSNADCSFSAEKFT